MPPSSRVALVTGGAGFIGSHLADRLLADGWTVVAIDNFAIGRESNVAHLRQHPGFTFVLGDVVDRDAVVRLAIDCRADTIFHLAAVHYIPFCNAHPYDAIRINVLGTQAMIDAAVASGARRLVFTSTSDVYATKDLPFVESDPIDPYTIYGTTKFTAERLLRVAATANQHLSVSIARLFNVYGPRETNPHVLPEIIDQLKAGAHQIRLGNLWPRRDFIYVTDVANALVELAGIDAKYDAFNVGSGTATSIGDAVAMIAALAERRIEIVADSERARPVERGCLHADIAKITRETAWRAQHTFEAGMSTWLGEEQLAPAGRSE
jgi:UDP-glucose 4-epimerase